MKTNDIELQVRVDGTRRMRRVIGDRRSYIVAIGVYLLAQLTASGALAQGCNTAANPAPPNITIPTVNGQTFGPAPKPTFLIDLRGAGGCTGAENNGTGGDGYAGQPSASATLDMRNVTTIGGSTGYIVPFVNGLVGAPFVAYGSAGGTGGQSDYWSFPDTHGGNGGAAGGAGSFTGTLQDFTINGVAGSTLMYGLLFDATGGPGGSGGNASRTLYPSEGGAGSGGAPGGAIFLSTVQMTIKGPSPQTGAGFYATGGYGGNGGPTNYNVASTWAGAAGAGGAGGRSQAAMIAGTDIVASVIGVDVVANGGRGGDGGGSGASGGESHGGAAGAGGNGGLATLSFDGTVSVTGAAGSAAAITGLRIEANGGRGGDGGLANNALGGYGGAGGNGGAGGTAQLVLLGDVDVTGAADKDAVGGQGVLIQGSGGFGGYGSLTQTDSGYGGNGGAAGNGQQALLTLGNVTAPDPAKIITEGTHLPGVVAQAIGGGGGSGGAAQFWASGGAGANGGNGGAVGVTGNQAWTITSGAFSRALVAQSIGGGGGVGGNSNDVNVGAGYAVGGNGGAGGNGSSVKLALNGGTNNIFASLSEYGGGGVLAQSIGGSGGAGGNASEKGFGLFTMVVGGDSGAGGTASTVDVNSTAIVTTMGDHAAGLKAQSIGGGGGVAGVAVGTEVGLLPTAAVAVGGRGGSGGTGDAVSIENAGQITTYGSDAFGIEAQSIGGGGGSGGSATATAIDFSPSEDVPAVSVSYAAGGAGGSGNTGGAAGVTNSGYVITAGHGAMAIKAQSIGGGGGHAGDASAASYTGTTSSDANISIDLSVALGGAGGVGGAAGTVSIDNSGLLYTTGQDAHAVLAQSVGGGGGTGGVGDTSATAVVDDLSISVDLGVGGKGGTGGHGGDVTLKNETAAVISTRGDASDGVFAQSVGGGGGAAGGGSAATSGGTISLAVAVGGSGGAGGDGGDVTLENDGLVATVGTDSLGLSAQSVGGGGGRGGKAGATAGGADDDLPLFVGDQIADAFNLSDAPSTEIYNDIFELSDRVKSDVTTVEKLVDHFSGKAPKPGESDDISLSIQAGVALGGSGGAAGHGGDITLTNTGDILTQGAHGDAVIGQSVGGGGGIGGFSVASGASSDDTTPNLALSAGGKGGGAGNGGNVTVSHSGSVETAGVGAFGLVAQTVGGGGGRGGGSADQNASALSFGVSLGGGGGSTGDGGKAEIDLACTTSGGACSSGTGGVLTTGKHAVGVLAQSVGGGGGLIRTMQTDQQGDQSGSDDDDDADTHNIFLDLGVRGASGAQGKGGAAMVNLTSGTSVTTSGRNAHGVVASSVGGGGGAVGGGVVNLIHWDNTIGAATGDAGTATIALQGAQVSVTGKNSAALWASSIGGGGRVLLTDAKASALDATPTGQSGNGGTVSVTVDKGSSVSATGGGHAIVAHSLGGGGLSVFDGGGVGPTQGGKAWQSVYRDLSYHGAGTAGNVNVLVTGDSSVSATGANASAIVAAVAADVTQGVDPKSAAVATVEVTAGSTVSNASASNATIQLISSLNLSQVTNAGTIANSNSSGYALFNGGAAGGITLRNTGKIVGNLGGATTAPGGIAVVRNEAGGVLAPYDTIDLGRAGELRNAGAIEAGGVSRIADTTVTGDLIQTHSGLLRFDLDSEAQKVDRLHVEGAASLDGGFEFVPVTLLPGTYEVLTAEAGVTLATDLGRSGTHVFTFTPDADGDRLRLSTEADFLAQGADTADRRSIGRHLQRAWDAGGGDLGGGFASFAGIRDAETYRSALDTTSAQSVAAVGYARYLGGQAFAQSTYSCPRFEEASVFKTQGSCGWLKVAGSWLDRDASGDDPGFDFDAVTTSIGGQRQIGDGLFLGGALGWEENDLRDDANRTSVDGDALLGAVSLKKLTGPWTLTGAVDFGFGSYDSTRRITVGGATETAKASPDATNAGLHLRAAYQIPRGTWYAEPALDLDLAYVKLEGYTEKGGGDFGLEVDDSDTVVLTGTPWLKLGRRVDLDDRRLFDAYAAVGVSLSTGEDFDTTARFLAAPGEAGSFTTTLDNPNVVGRVSAGVEFYATDRVQLRLQYDGSFAEGQTTNGGQFRLSYFF